MSQLEDGQELDPQEITGHRAVYELDKGFQMLYKVKSTRKGKEGFDDVWVSKSDLMDQGSGKMPSFTSQKSIRKLQDLVDSYEHSNDSLENLGLTDSFQDSIEEDNEEDEVEYIVGHRILKDGQGIEYEVKWLGLDEEDNEWFHRVDLLVHAHDKVVEYERNTPSLRVLHEEKRLVKQMSVFLESTMPTQNISRIRRHVALEVCKDVGSIVLPVVIEKLIFDQIKKKAIQISKQYLQSGSQLANKYLIVQKLEQQVLQRQHKFATSIQRIVRGYITRIYVKQLHSIKTYSSIEIQRIVRGGIARKKVNSIKAYHDSCATIIQSQMRGFLRRKRYRELHKSYFEHLVKRYDSAVKIQAMWRKYIVERTYLNCKRARFNAAAAIQKEIRRYLQVSRYGQMLQRARMKYILKDYKTKKHREHRIVSIYCTKDRKEQLAFEALKLKQDSELPPLTESRKKQLIRKAIEAQYTKKIMKKLPRVSQNESPRTSELRAQQITHSQRFALFLKISQELEEENRERERRVKLNGNRFKLNPIMDNRW